jgi:hypothetical protein
MSKKLLAVAIAALVLNLVCVSSASAKPSADKDAQFAAKVKAGVLKLGTGPAARVEIKLRDGTKLKGYVTEALDDRFVVVDGRTGASRDVPYPQVKQAKGNNLSTGVTIAIVVGIILVVGTILGIAFAR